MAIRFNMLNWAQAIVQPGGQATREFYTWLNNIFNAAGSGETLGTAAFQSIGTSGDAVPLLNTVNTWADPQTYASGIILTGSSSGTTEVVASANAGGVLTLPTITTTLVGQNTTDTLTNKTLASPVVTGTASGIQTLPLAMLTPPVAVGQFPASATNDTATIGYIGEYKSATVTTGAAITLSTATATNVTSLALTAGNWLVTGNVGFLVTGTGVNNIQAWTTTVSATAPTAPNSGAYTILVTGSNWGNGTLIPAGVNRIAVTTTTSIYLGAFAAFASGSASAYGFIEAWRPR